ncbi:RagB/SusD family nutrient uptake outer membrane protein [Chitinophaga filiformis]|uniref:RagB/SusD family nutrient uptake outer membrane protein n=1 Tax=Chitinophaga filiformis TaxID=104663 RepID=A0ABY4IC94_CHIFI|nr:RagB/SusD family nutrient uptake outer membrane protein [Chitinophaga filiformis]UPK72839.1 RagB/SusD family nutrient uptake outer membrane protein [Chitinophaga filiformis]
MKRILGFVAAGLIILSGCSDFLDREPLSQISPVNGFNSESELRLYVRSFYDKMLPNADNEDNGFTSLYTETANNIVVNSLSPQIAGNRTVPVAGGGWDWTDLRNVNYFLQNYMRGNLDTTITYKYVAVAKFFRAYFYFSMVARFGDVPWYSRPIEADDTASLNKKRDPRTLVMDSVVNDIDFAIAHLGAGKDVAEVTKWTALALKSRICLFEGTFRKYHKEFELKDADRFLQIAADAAGEVIRGGAYAIYKSSPDNAYRDLFSSLSVVPEEIILARQYSANLQIFHNVNYYTTAPSFGKPGLEKSLVNSYLMKDGSRFTDRPGYDKMQFFEEMQNRDPRLGQTVRAPGYKRIDGNTVLPPSYAGTVTGYQLTKFVTAAANDALGKSPNPLPVFRYAEVLLNYAEAKAELGTITQADLDQSVKLLRDRVGMPAMDLAAANAAPDHYLAGQYTQVSGTNKGIILEIRRERRIELVMEGFMWNDLMRWKEGHLLAIQFKGAYFLGAGNYDLDGDGTPDLAIYTGTPPAIPNIQLLKLGTDVVLENGASGGNIIINGAIPKTFREDRDYLFPIPAQELLLNRALQQNPNW